MLACSVILILTVVLLPTEALCCGALGGGPVARGRLELTLAEGLSCYCFGTGWGGGAGGGGGGEGVLQVLQLTDLFNAHGTGIQNVKIYCYTFVGIDLMYWSQMLCGTRIEILYKENRIKLAKKYKQWVVVKIKEQLFECNCWKFHSPLPALSEENWEYPLYWLVYLCLHLISDQSGNASFLSITGG